MNVGHGSTPISLGDLHEWIDERDDPSNPLIPIHEAALTALITAVESALRLADQPFGQLDSRDFYALRERLAPFRRGE